MHHQRGELGMDWGILFSTLTFCLACTSLWVVSKNRDIVQKNFLETQEALRKAGFSYCGGMEILRYGYWFKAGNTPPDILIELKRPFV